MKLVLKEFSAQEPFSEGESPTVGALFDIVFEGTDMISGSIGASIPHPNPRSLTFDEAEKLAIDYVMSKM